MLEHGKGGVDGKGGIKRNRTTVAEDKKKYLDLLVAAKTDPEKSIGHWSRLFDLKHSTIQNVLNRADALASELSQPQRDKMAREWRLSFFRLQTMESQLAEEGMLTPRDAQALQISKGICQDKVNILEGMPSDITVNIDVVRSDLPAIGRRIVEGARIAGMLPSVVFQPTSETPPPLLSKPETTAPSTQDPQSPDSP